MDYYAIDAWDSETAYVTVDGETVWSTKWDRYGSSIGICGQDEKYGFYDKILPVYEDVEHSAATLVLAAGSTVAEQNSVNYRSFGIDNVIVWVR